MTCWELGTWDPPYTEWIEALGPAPRCRYNNEHKYKSYEAFTLLVLKWHDLPSDMGPMAAMAVPLMDFWLPSGQGWDRRWQKDAASDPSDTPLWQTQRHTYADSRLWKRRPQIKTNTQDTRLLLHFGKDSYTESQFWQTQTHVHRDKKHHYIAPNVFVFVFGELFCTAKNTHDTWIYPLSTWIYPLGTYLLNIARIANAVQVTVWLYSLLLNVIIQI